ncbi:50S ribosomal protein L3 [Spiroplasma endosymbiont of Anurida maritima]|uniref:50S ribosomal protein L3 n=1 Tax=Spiroplasma endosymbiont of Anurida maritima TaxID=2967972 RepID=UPI0036D35E57
MKGILGRKIGMTQVFTEEGMLLPVTAIEVLPNVVLESLTAEKNGYVATKIASEDKRVNLVNKADQGQFKKANTNPKRFIKEIRNMTGYNAGDVVKADLFSAGELVDITGTSKGKGFAGVVKRHNYSIGPMGHGSGFHRQIGSMGVITNNRIVKGKKMPGQHGALKRTVQNLEIVSIDVEKNVILIRGSVPGPKKQLVVIKQAIKNPKAKTPAILVNYNKATEESNAK